MRTIWTILASLLLLVGTARADDMILSTNAPSGTDIDWTVEVDGSLTPPEVTRDAWIEGERGVIIQFLDAPNPLAPVNPLAPPPPRFTEATLNRDTVTGRVMGLNLLTLEF